MTAAAYSERARGRARQGATTVKFNPAAPVAVVIDTSGRSWQLRPAIPRGRLHAAPVPNWLVSLKPASMRRWPEPIEYALLVDDGLVDRCAFDGPAVPPAMAAAVEEAIGRVLSFEDNIIVKARRQTQETHHEHRAQD